MTQAEFIQVLKGRAFLYDFLGRMLLGPPSADLLRECRDIGDRLGEMCRRLGQAEAATGYEHVVGALAALPADEADALLELNRQYTATFSVGGQAVSLYESTYRTVEGFVKQEPWEDVCAFYEESGLGLAPVTEEMEDHAGIELAFMGQLVYSAVEALVAPDGGSNDPVGVALTFDEAMAAQRRFMEEHLALWLPEAMGQVVTRAVDRRAPFFGGLAGVVIGFLRVEREFLAAW